jgi:uncharacterized protein YdeI (YjbR/CyaY-like superfamily)
MDETLLFKNADAWADWLREHHASVAGVWLRLGKKGSLEKAVSYAEALEVALCFGWIDGQKKSYSEHQFL